MSSRNNYEYEAELGTMVRNRVLPANVRYPVDYGLAASTVSTDGEPLDAVVAAYDRVFPGCVVRARNIGAVEVKEARDTEPNIFAVPDDGPRLDDMRTGPEITCKCTR